MRSRIPARSASRSRRRRSPPWVDRAPSPLSSPMKRQTTSCRWGSRSISAIASIRVSAPLSGSSLPAKRTTRRPATSSSSRSSATAPGSAGWRSTPGSATQIRSGFGTVQPHQRPALGAAHRHHPVALRGQHLLDPAALELGREPGGLLHPPQRVEGLDPRDAQPLPDPARRRSAQPVVGVDQPVGAPLGGGVGQQGVGEGLEQGLQLLLGDRVGRAHVEQDQPAARGDQPLSGKAGVVPADEDVGRDPALGQALAEPADPDVHPAVVAAPQLAEGGGVDRDDGDRPAARTRSWMPSLRREARCPVNHPEGPGPRRCTAVPTGAPAAGRTRQFRVVGTPTVARPTTLAGACPDANGQAHIGTRPDDGVAMTNPLGREISRCSPSVDTDGHSEANGQLNHHVEIARASRPMWVTFGGDGLPE